MKRLLESHRIFWVIWLASSGCIEAIDLPLQIEDYESHLVVDGRITTDPGPYFIELEKTDALGLGKVAPVLGAEVWVQEDLAVREQAKELGDGTYCLLGEQIQGKIGRSYRIEIILEGEVYRSEPEILPPPVEISDIRFNQELVEIPTPQNGFSRRFVVQVQIDLPVPKWEKGPFILWETEETYTANDSKGDELVICYYTKPVHPQKIQLFNGQGFTANSLNQVQLIERELDWTFELRHVLSIYQVSLTEEAFQYWSRVDQVINQNGSIFDPPPGAIRGNIANVSRPKELVLGYFSAVSVDTARLTTFASDFRFGSVPPRCPFTPSAIRPPSCESCWLQDNVFFDRPSYFDE